MNTQFYQYIHSMILSASGWRMIFAQNGNGEDYRPEIGPDKSAISAFIGKTFADYLLGNIDGLKSSSSSTPVIAVGMDARPTGLAIADCIIKVLVNSGIDVRFTGISPAPEIMAYARSLDGFIYISASHNPIGYNGIKFGLNDGGVIPGNIATKLAAHFRKLCETENPENIAISLMNIKTNPSAIKKITDIYATSHLIKEQAVAAYRNFTMQVITGKIDTEAQKKAFEPIINGIKKYHLGIVADMNGSARTLSIDSTFFAEQGLQFYPINNIPGQIVHAIIPEPENLVFCATKMEQLQAQGKTDAVLGYMPDCDGDRGNVVYWNTKTQKSDVLKAQEVFSLSVLAELAYSTWEANNQEIQNCSKLAIAVNGPTSMRIDDIAQAFGAYVGRAEVGEANVVNKARELRKDGYEVRILGEGSNGGNITHPAAVRDPINTLFALIKLLSIRDTVATVDKPAQKGLFHLWCQKSNQETLYTDDFTLVDVINTLPKYITTGVSEPRAVLQVNTDNQGKLKANFQKVFETEWAQKKDYLATNYGFYSYMTITANETKITENISDYSLSGKGGLKIIFNDKSRQPIAYMWMRGSGTEPVFRIQCDVKDCNTSKTATQIESELLEWETEMLAIADKQT
jgi:phosphoglucomutase